MRLFIVLPLTALALAACNSSDTIVAKDESAESVAAKSPKAISSRCRGAGNRQ
jgi:hypothetical protein